MNIPDDVKTLGHTVRWARRELGLTVDEVARHVGISKPGLQNIEYGNTKAGPVLVARLEVELHVALQGLTQRPAKFPPRLLERHQTGHGAGLPRGGTRIRAIAGRKKQHICSACFSLAHRRPRVGRCWCGGRFAEEPASREIPSAQSSMGLCEDAA